MLVVAGVGLGYGAQAGLAALRTHFGGDVPAVSAAPPLELEAMPMPPAARERFEQARVHAGEFDVAAAPRLVEWVDAAGRPLAIDAGKAPPERSLRVEYSLDEKLSGEVHEVLRQDRVARGHAMVLDPRTGRMLAVASTSPDDFPAHRPYPAASIVKVLTAAALLEKREEAAIPDCVYRGNKYRISRRRLDRAESGRTSGLEEALASSNNQCFSQWAVNDLGEAPLRAILGRFGWLGVPAPGFEAGRLDPVESRYDLGQLGSGLDGLRVTPMHVASLTTVLTGGALIEPWWVDRIVDAQGRSIEASPRPAAQPVLTRARAEALREMMVATTQRGTARRAFRTRRGRPLLPEIRVAGKTGNLNGRDPFGRYEWFVGLAPAEAPTVAVVVLQLHDHLWWKKSSEVAAHILREVFCDRSRCAVELAARVTGDLPAQGNPLRVSDLRPEGGSDRRVETAHSSR